jgi:hypothetical protein
MAIQLGSTAIAANKIKLGTTAVTKVYLGTTLIWPPTSGSPVPVILWGSVF